MPVQTLCPNCRKPLNLTQEQLARPLACPHCGRTLHPKTSRSQSAPDTTPETGAARSIPSKIGRYDVRRKLGEGGMGLVLEGFDPSLNRPVAIKLVRADKLIQRPDARKSAAVERFIREAQSAASLRHPNIVQVFDVGEQDGAPYIVTEFIAGRTLAEVLTGHDNGLEPAAALSLMIQLLDALQAAHAGGIIHRDIKPDNALVDAQGKVYLMDFGLAGWVEQDGTRLTQAGATIGTPHYMPPEQIGNAGGVGPAADQYSAGVTLYELLTGHLPFSGAENAFVLMYQIQNGTPTPPRDWRRDLDPGLEAICLKAIHKNPVERYPSCGALANELRRWLQARGLQPAIPETSGGSGRPPRGTSTLGDPGRGQQTLEAPPTAVGRQGWSVLALVGAAVALLLIGAACFALALGLKSDKKTPPTKPRPGIVEKE